MKILFLDQSGQLGGAELCLADLAQHYRNSCRVCTFADGPFPQQLAQRHIEVAILGDHPLNFQKQSGLGQAVKSLGHLVPLILQVSRLSHRYDCIYANTQKALVVGAMASLLSQKPLVYHLHDIVSAEHFSHFGQQTIVALANRAALVIANSAASQSAFVAAGGNAERTHVVYNGFDLDQYIGSSRERSRLRSALGIEEDRFVVGHFSRISPWKGQHVLLEALQHCPPQVTAVFVGDTLFGEDDYLQRLYQQIERLALGDRVKFLGFRSDIPQLMDACDLVAHTSIATEPFGRVIVEAMLSDCAVVAAEAGGALEIIDSRKTGWLIPPGDAAELANTITEICAKPEEAALVSKRAKAIAQQKFDLNAINAQLEYLLSKVLDI